MPEPEKLWLADIELSKAQARRVILSQFLDIDCDSIDFFGEGWDNRVYLVDRKLLFRFPRRKIAVELMIRENQVLPLIAERFDIKISAPTFVGQASEEFPYPFNGYPIITGTVASDLGLSDQVRLEILPQFAGFLRTLHSIREVEARKLGAKEQVLTRTDFVATSKKLKQRLSAVATAVTLDGKVVEKIINSAASVPLDGGHCLIHGDLYSRHLVISQNRLNGVIDWGDFGVNHPVVDIACLYSFFPPESHALFFDVYGKFDLKFRPYARYLGLYSTINLMHYSMDVGDQHLWREAMKSLGYLGCLLPE